MIAKGAVMTRRLSFIRASFALAVLPACGGGGSSPGGPSGGGNPVLPGEAATILVLSNSVSPREVTVPVGSRVNFVNQTGNNIEIHSDPHPIHTDCPPLNNVGVLRAGQTGQTGPLTVARRCGFHDHGRPDDDRFQGTIIVQ
jgi:hypothetical protein